MQDSQRFAAQSQDSQRRAMTRSAEPRLATICSAEPRLAAQMQDSQRRCRTRNDLQQARIAAQSQDSQRRAWTRSAEARIAARRQDSHAAERRERSSHRRSRTRSALTSHRLDSQRVAPEAHRSSQKPLRAAPHTIPYHTIPDSRESPERALLMAGQHHRREAPVSAPNAEGVCYLDDLVLSLSALGMHFFTLAVPERAKHMRRLWKGAPHFKSAASLGLRAQLPTTVALRRALGIVHVCVVSVWQTMGGYRL